MTTTKLIIVGAVAGLLAGTIPLVLINRTTPAPAITKPQAKPYDGGFLLDGHQRQLSRDLQDLKARPSPGSDTRKFDRDQAAPPPAKQPARIVPRPSWEWRQT